MGEWVRSCYKSHWRSLVDDDDDDVDVDDTDCSLASRWLHDPLGRIQVVMM